MVAAEAMVARVRVASYNVLSSSLCEADYHTKCTPSNLDAANRFRRVLAQLDLEVEAGGIVCLQEVSTNWAGQLHAYFSEKGYYMMHMGYGNKFDGYMGVAIAFPTAKYRLQKARIERTADLRPWPRSQGKPGLRARIKESVVSAWRNWRGLKRPVDPIWDAKKRANQMVMARLEDRESGAAFCVATFHMPCQFRVPVVMVTHMALAMRELQLAAGAAPLVFCGDFNVKPGDAAYRLATEGSLAKSDEHYPDPTLNNGWAPKVEYAMKSAYKEANGREPEITNWGFTRGSDEEFKDCLDYIFCSDGVEVQGVKQVSVAGGPLPTAAEPSDHVLIAADLLITDRGNSPTSGRKEQRSEDEIKQELESKLEAFLADESQDDLYFPRSLSSYERMLVHRICEETEDSTMSSASTGQGRMRRIIVTKNKKTE